MSYNGGGYSVPMVACGKAEAFCLRNTKADQICFWSALVVVWVNGANLAIL